MKTQALTDAIDYAKIRDKKRFRCSGGCGKRSNNQLELKGIADLGKCRCGWHPHEYEFNIKSCKSLSGKASYGKRGD